MKRIIWVLTLIICIFCVSVCMAEQYNIGFVTCTNLTVRETPASNGKKVTGLKNGDYVVITGSEYNSSRGESFYKVISKEAWDAGTRDTQGYVLEQFVQTGIKRYINCTSFTNFYALPGSRIAVAGNSDGPYLILDEMTTLMNGSQETWYGVQPRSGFGCSSAVRASEVSAPFTMPEDEQFMYSVMGYYPESGDQTGYVEPVQPVNPPSQTGVNGLYNGCQALVNCNTLAVRANPDDNLESLGFLHNGDIVQVYQVGEYYSSIYYDYKGVKVIGYVHTEHLLAIAN